MTLRIPPSFDPDTLRHVLALLKGCDPKKGATDGDEKVRWQLQRSDGEIGSQ